MKSIRLGSSVTIFLLFFGMATLEAFRMRSWLVAAFWLGIGLVFVVGDNLQRRSEGHAPGPRPTVRN